MVYEMSMLQASETETEPELMRSMMAYHAQSGPRVGLMIETRVASALLSLSAPLQHLPVCHSAVCLCVKWHTVLSTLQAAQTHSALLGLQQLRASQPVVCLTSCCLVMGCPVCVVLLCNVAHQRISCRASIRLDGMLTAHTC